MHFTNLPLASRQCAAATAGAGPRSARELISRQWGCASEVSISLEAEDTTDVRYNAHYIAAMSAIHAKLTCPSVCFRPIADIRRARLPDERW